MDLFVSYAWTSDQHRQWVRLLASEMHLLGYDVRIDQDVDYGNSLNGFMRSVVDARHVLLVVDENYVQRADTRPDSGVGIENARIREVYDERPANWASALFVNNPTFQLPGWLVPHQPRSFDFNAEPTTGDFPGSEQLDDLWRWLEGLPPDKTNAIPLRTQVARAARLERIANLRDPGLTRSPALEGEVNFEYGRSTSSIFTLGQGDFEFPFQVSSHGFNSVTVYADRLQAVGLIRQFPDDPANLEGMLTPGRTVTPTDTQGVVLMNHQGAICEIRVLEVQREINDSREYVAPSVRFVYKIHLEL